MQWETSACVQSAVPCVNTSGAKTDYLIRFGGEEFVIFAVANSPADAAERLETLRRGIEQLRVPTSDGQEVRVSVSIGYCRLVPEIGQRSEQWLRMADRAVYEAKRKGPQSCC